MKEIPDLLISNLFENLSHAESLRRLMQQAGTIEIVCPFISREGARWLLDNKNSNAKITLITELSTRGVISGVQSPDALRMLLKNGAEIHYLTDHLHAKWFWFNRTTAVITSANLTLSGLSKNFELGVCLAPMRTRLVNAEAA